MTLAEKAHKSILADAGCLVCNRLYETSNGPVQLHHFRGGGWGKGDYTTLIPLCLEHHSGKTGVHGMGTKAFDRHYADMGFTQWSLMEEAQQIVADSLHKWRK